MTKDEAISLLNIHKSEEVWADDIAKAIDIAIEALIQNQWIPCSERLPEIDEDVFISVGERVCEAHLRATREYFITHKIKAFVAVWDADAWMPLPKAYERRTE